MLYICILYVVVIIIIIMYIILIFSAKQNKTKQNKQNWERNREEGLVHPDTLMILGRSSWERNEK